MTPWDLTLGYLAEYEFLANLWRKEWGHQRLGFNSDLFYFDVKKDIAVSF